MSIATRLANCPRVHGGPHIQASVPRTIGVWSTVGASRRGCSRIAGCESVVKVRSPWAQLMSTDQLNSWWVCINGRHCWHSEWCIAKGRTSHRAAPMAVFVATPRTQRRPQTRPNVLGDHRVYVETNVSLDATMRLTSCRCSLRGLNAVGS